MVRQSHYLSLKCRNPCLKLESNEAARSPVPDQIPISQSKKKILPSLTPKRHVTRSIKLARHRDRPSPAPPPPPPPPFPDAYRPGLPSYRPAARATPSAIPSSLYSLRSVIHKINRYCKPQNLEIFTDETNPLWRVREYSRIRVLK